MPDPDARAGAQTVVTPSQIAVFAAVNVVVGATVAATSVAVGLSVTKSIVLTVALFAGASQLAAIAVMLAGGPAWAMWVAAMLVNARFVMLGASIAPHVRMRAAARAGAAWLLVDPVAIMVRAERDAGAGARTYWRSGLGLLSAWTFGSIIGANGLTLVEDLDALGGDVALPALLLGLLASNLRDRGNVTAAAAGGAITLFLLLVAPPGLAVLVGSLGAAVPLLAKMRPWREVDS